MNQTLNKSIKEKIIDNALDKARTVKRLLEQWPEAKELLPAEDAVVPPASCYSPGSAERDDWASV